LSTTAAPERPQLPKDAEVGRFQSMDDLCPEEGATGTQPRVSTLIFVHDAEERSRLGKRRSMVRTEHSLCLCYAVPSPARAHGDSFQDGSERALNSSEKPM